MRDAKFIQIVSTSQSNISDGELLALDAKGDIWTYTVIGSMREGQVVTLYGWKKLPGMENNL